MADVGTEAVGRRAFPRLQWSAIIAGVFVALAAHVVLGLIGAALGFAAEPADSSALGAGAAIWALLTPFVASLIGAWVAVRLAGAFDEAGSNLHGVLVWCIGLLAGALFLTGAMATGAMTAGAAASGNAGALRRSVQGAEARVDPDSPRAQANAERASDEAGKAAAATAGGGAMAAIAGLLGAFAGAGIARRRREGRGLAWTIGQRLQGGHQDERRTSGSTAGRMEERRVEERTYGPSAGGYGSPESRIVNPSGDPTRPESSDPFHH
jgi:hypothetical protein